MQSPTMILKTVLLANLQRKVILGGSTLDTEYILMIYR